MNEINNIFGLFRKRPNPFSISVWPEAYKYFLSRRTLFLRKLFFLNSTVPELIAKKIIGEEVFKELVSFGMVKLSKGECDFLCRIVPCLDVAVHLAF